MIFGTIYRHDIYGFLFIIADNGRQVQAVWLNPETRDGETPYRLWTYGHTTIQNVLELITP